MKISKFKFLRLFAKHFAKKLSIASLDESQLNVLAVSLNPAFSQYFSLMEVNGLMKDSCIDVELLDQKTKEFFLVVPVLNFPLGQQTLSITKQDADAFIKDLFKYADVEEIIYLPCQN